MDHLAWLEYERTLARLATRNSNPILDLHGKLPRLTFLAAVSLTLGGVSYWWRGYEVDGLTIISAVIVPTFYAVVWLWFWMPTPFLLHREAAEAASADIRARDAEIALLNLRLMTKAKDRALIDEMLKVYVNLLDVGDDLSRLSLEDGGNAERYPAWNTDYQAWAAVLMQTLKQYHPLEAYKLERVLLTVGAPGQEYTRRQGVTAKAWNRSLDRFDREHGVLAAIVLELRGQALAA